MARLENTKIYTKILKPWFRATPDWEEECHFPPQDWTDSDTGNELHCREWNSLQITPNSLQNGVIYSGS